jgi:hypothetical protein
MVSASQPSAGGDAAATADAGPSLGATFEWLWQNLGSNQVHTRGWASVCVDSDAPDCRVWQASVSTMEPLGVEGCTLTYRELQTGDVAGCYVVKLEFAVLDTGDVRVAKYSETGPGKALTFEQDAWVVLAGKGNVYSGVPFADRDKAERVARAFQRAITLCGGKVDIF